MASFTSSQNNDLDDVPLPVELQSLSIRLEDSPEALATGDKDLQVAALQAAKYVFDLALKTESKSRGQLVEFLTSISPSEAPKTRSQTATKGKRKRSPTPPPPAHLDIVPKETPLPELCVDGMDEDQLWTQLDLRAKGICDFLEYTMEAAGEQEESDEDENELKALKKRKMMSEEGEDIDDMSMDGLDDIEDSEEESEEEDEDKNELSDEEDEEVESEDDGDDAHLGESTVELRDPSDEEDEESDLDLDQQPSFLSGGQRKSKWKRKAASHPELDDGFFDLAAFNAETEEAEARASSRGKLSRDDDSDEEDEEDASIDYFAQVDDDVEEEDADLFEPPSRSVSKPKPKPKPTGQVRFHEEVLVRKIKPKGKGLPVNTQFTIEEEDDEEGEDGEWEEDDEGMSDGISEELEEEEGSEFDGESEDDQDEGFKSRDTIARLKGDLFAEEDEEPESDLTTYQKRMASLQEEIAQLEAENVAKKHWTLMGEATSRSRPQNALLEEDLEFERVMKSVPVITEETVQGLEERIKARILESRFDDVVRKRAVDDKPFLPSKFFELQDTKSKQSLAEIYEGEYTAAQTGGVTGEDRDGKLAKEHKEIEKLWENICSKLDALSNAHFTPKAPKAIISTVSNVSAATMESALPTTMATNTMLAPEEVYAPSPKDLVARSELTPAQKRALHNKQKKTKKKARQTLENSVDKYSKVKGIKGIKMQKNAALKSLVKTGKGITVVGKKGQDSGSKAKRKST
ncbi:unnamed protein product [Somion occarium]|uniref:U3 small nucleolar ribonucleoprotein protein MPP10 n=1 Tax=Somion occarium TaxID=3059160 RepID=A0ABP1E8V7_9APHY